MLDFLSTYSKIENPTIGMIFFTFILSFVLSAVIAFTYEQTTLVNVRNYGLMQTFILSALIATMVLQAIGDNVASGLGMLGALTVVQFRTNLRNPRDMIFMFASLGTGIACGLYGFLIALMGVTFFCVVVFMIRYSPFHFSHMPVWNLKLKGEDSVFRNPNFKQLLTQYCLYHTLESVEPDKDGSKIYQYHIMLKEVDQQDLLLQNISDLQASVYSFSKKKDK